MIASACQKDKIGCEEIIPEAAIMPRAALFAQEAPKTESKQPLIKAILSDYNKQILHDAEIEENLKVAGTVIAFKLPGEILITKDNKTLSIIKDPALLETIRLSLVEREGKTRQLGPCLEWGAKQVWVYVQGKLVEKTIEVCLKYAEEAVNHPLPHDPETHPYPQAPGYSSGCYTHPDGQVVCE